MATVQEMYRAMPEASIWVVPGQGHIPVWQCLGADAYSCKLFSQRAMEFLHN